MRTMCSSVSLHRPPKRIKCSSQVFFCMMYQKLASVSKRLFSLYTCFTHFFHYEHIDHINKARITRFYVLGITKAIGLKNNGENGFDFTGDGVGAFCFRRSLFGS